MRILLTGASGFLGSALARHFVAAGNKVSLILRPSSRLLRLHDIKGAFDIERCATDCEISEFILRVNPDVVIHTACTYDRKGENILEIVDTNVRFGLQLLKSIKLLEKSITFINTGTDLPPEVSQYALTKHQFSQWGKVVAAQSLGQLRFINVLLQHMYGPGDDQSKFTSHVIHACQSNVPNLKLTLGEQKRDFVYIDDVVNGYDSLIKCKDMFDPFIDVPIGSGTAPTVRQFIELVHSLTGSSTQLDFGVIPYRDNEAMHCQADLKIMTQIGWKPIYDLESGLKKYIEMEFLK